MLTLERLHEALTYDALTGKFTWNAIDRSFNRRSGKVAGSVVGKYRRICIDQSYFLEHRLAWYWMTGKWPQKGTDHINMNTRDNRFANLREANQSQNMANTGRQANNTSGLKGVSLYKSRGKWQAQICVKGVRKGLGHFDCPAAAHLAYVIAMDKAHGTFARFDRPATSLSGS